MVERADANHKQEQVMNVAQVDQNGKQKAKNLRLALGFILALTSTSTMARVSQSANFTVVGHLNQQVSISIKSNPVPSFSFINTTQMIHVGSVFELSNAIDGYVVKARSLNNGKFLSPDGKQSIPYNLKYGEGVPLSLTKDNQTVSERTSQDSMVNSENFISISLRQLPDNYSARNPFQDFITFTIESR